MSKAKKISFLVFPIIIFVVFVCALCLSFWRLMEGIQGFHSTVGFIGFMAGIFHLVFVMVYIMHAISNQKLGKAEKVVWGILIYSFNVAVMPFYWYFYIKSE